MTPLKKLFKLLEVEVSNLYYIYILRCSDDTLYTGYTNSIDKRLFTHNSGKGAKYTRARLPVELIYSEEFSDKINALKREREIKSMTRTEKLRLLGDENI